ncbi:MAG: hypothetical protein AAB288_02065, partial [Acidobacteriota bacterium]
MPVRILEDVMTVRSANAKRYVDERRLDGLNIEQADLRVLAVDMAVPVDVIAVLLRCHLEILLRKAQRWGIPVSYAARPAPRKPPSRPNSERDISRGYRPRYGAKLDLAADFIQSRGLDKRDPSPEELEYLYISLRLSKRILDNLLRGRAGFLLERAGLEKRTATEQRLLGYDASFFGEWTPASAWVIGLIYTDGNLSGGKVTFSSVDEDLIKKAQALAAPT